MTKKNTGKRQSMVYNATARCIENNGASVVAVWTDGVSLSSDNGNFPGHSGNFYCAMSLVPGRQYRVFVEDLGLPGENEENMSLQDKAHAFAAKHVAECSREILGWRRTGVLEQGKVRDLESIIETLGFDDPTRVAEQYVIKAALQAVALPREE